MVELVSSAACSSLPVFNLNGNDGTDSIDDERIYNGADRNTSLGGIAISCRTNADILEIGSYVQSLVLTQQDGEYSTTESGIYISAPSTGKKKNINRVSKNAINAPSSIAVSETCEISKRDVTITFAAVIPFDTALWETAALLFR